MKKTKPKSKAKPKPKKKLGRKLKYDPIIVLPKLEKLAAKGLTNLDIAKSFGINESTFYDWQEKYSEFSLSLKKYRGLADIEVENALYKSAIGFEFEEVKRVRTKNGKTGKFEMVVTELNKKIQTGNATAQIFYLKNRMPERYRDKIETVHTFTPDMESVSFTFMRREAEPEPVIKKEEEEKK